MRNDRALQEIQQDVRWRSTTNRDLAEYRREIGRLAGNPNITEAERARLMQLEKAYTEYRLKN